MKWLLIYVVLTTDFAKIASFGEFETMDECFNARDELVELVGRPIQNYQAICVWKNEEEIGL